MSHTQAQGVNIIDEGDSMELKGPFLSNSGIDLSADDEEFNDESNNLEDDQISCSSDIFPQNVNEAKSAGSTRPVSPIRSPPMSSIPLPIRSFLPVKSIPRKDLKPIRNTIPVRSSTIANKHTLEIQFINKNKRYLQTRKELSEKQQVLTDQYKSLMELKSKLAKLGRTVKVKDMKLVLHEEIGKATTLEGAGENAANEKKFTGVNDSMVDVPQALMELCKTLLLARSSLVSFLEYVRSPSRSQQEISAKLQCLELEGGVLEKLFETILNEHVPHIEGLISTWNSLIDNGPEASKTITDLKKELKEKEKATEQFLATIKKLEQQLEDGKASHTKKIYDYNEIIQKLENQLRTLDKEMEKEQKVTSELMNKNAQHVQNIDSMRSKIDELEYDNAKLNTTKNNLQQETKVLQQKIKKLIASTNIDKNKFESDQSSEVWHLQNKIETLTKELTFVRTEIGSIMNERDEALQKCDSMEKYVSEKDVDEKEFKYVSSCESLTSEEEEQKRDQRVLEAFRNFEKQSTERSSRKKRGQVFHSRLTRSKSRMLTQQKKIDKYKNLLSESEKQIEERTMEMEKLQFEMEQLKSQQTLEYQEYVRCADKSTRMDQSGVDELIRKGDENQSKMEQLSTTMERQAQKISEMENTLRYKHNVEGVLRISRDKLIVENESLSSYSNEMRETLAEITKEGKMKDRLIKEMQQKIEYQHKKIRKLQKLVYELESCLTMSRKRKDRVREAVQMMEHELTRNLNEDVRKIPKPR